ncbi:pendrin [Astyanax mexicanus]|uniref:pendrin n=1 Tax=Astyanax mexicanus TaxID=7994 RepID=UPI0020CB5CF3|nr:pendrin [Astyanax mexicanus]
MDGQNQYLVARPIYSTRAFEHANERQVRERKTFKEKFTNSARSTLTPKLPLIIIKKFFPILQWLPIYQLRQWLPGDIVSGITTGMVCALQGLAYSLLVGVGPVYGLYAAFFPILTYFILGTSRHLSVGPFPVTCLMQGAVVLSLAPDELFMHPGNTTVNGTATLVLNVTQRDANRLSIATTMTVLIGLFQFGMGVAQVGFLVRYLSDPLVGGFTTAAAFHVVVSQLKLIFNVPTGNYNGILSFFYTIGDIFKNIKQTNMVDLIAAVLTIIVVMGVKEFNAKFQHKLPVPIPVEVIVTIIDSGVSYAMDLSTNYGAGIVRTIPRGFIPPRPPDVSLFSSFGGPSFSTGVVSYAIAISVAKVYAAKHDLTVDGNQELIAFGISNIFCGCFSGFVATTALSRTAIQESTGGKTQVASIISALMVLIVIVALGPLLQPLQKSVLGAIVVSNLKGMFMQVHDVPILWRKNKTDCLIWVFTFIACIFLGLDVGLLTGVVIELATVVIRTQFPSCATLGNIPTTEIYKNMKDYKNITEFPGTKIFKCTAPIYFANIEFLKDQIKSKVGFDAVQVFKKRNKALKKIHRLLKNGKLKITENGLVPVGTLGVENEAFESEQDPKQVETKSQKGAANGTISAKDVEMQVDWSSSLPGGVTVPKVDIHSFVMDFTAVSFLDVMAAKSLKLIIKEFLRIGVNVYIAGCDDEIILKMESMGFFDEMVHRGMLFLTVHDAILYIKMETGSETADGSDTFAEKISQMQDDKIPYVEDEDFIETYDNQRLAIHGLSS